MRVGVIDYGVGNLGSVLRALGELGVTAILVDRAVDMRATDALILPGAGSFAACSRILIRDGWTPALKEQVLDYKRPLLGICLGMQLLADSSTEGSDEDESTSGLGFISGEVKHLKNLKCVHRVPHVGWNRITRTRQDDPLLDHIPDGTEFYFAHSYAFVPTDSVSILATVDYSVPVTAVVRSQNVWGVQFHPEKSSRAGLRVLRNFIEGSVC
jgi:glutamine amidotransferase